jgi:hypothetical protein
MLLTRWMMVVNYMSNLVSTHKKAQLFLILKELTQRCMEMQMLPNPSQVVLLYIV